MSRRPPLPSYFLATILTTASAMASTSAPSNLPQVDYSKMGSVGLGGSFSGLDWWSSSSSSSSNTSFSTDGDTIFVRTSGGTYQALGGTNSGGRVNTMCWANSTDTNGTLYIGGSFSSISSTSSANVISYSISSSTFHSLASGLSGEVHTLYCDNAHNQVWAGGLFDSPTGSGGNVAVWSGSAWTSPAFGGLDGIVQDISPSLDGNSLYFSGGFTTTFVSNTTSINNITNTSIPSVQSAPLNTSTVGNSGYLTPVTLPPTSSGSSGSVGNLRINAAPATSQSQYDDASVLLCPGSGAWLGQDNTLAQIDVEGTSYLMATGARISNTLVEGRGTTQFCITSLPDNTQLNMTYTDPATGANMTCSEYCPLSLDPTIFAQDFLFEGGSRNLTGLQMELKSWQGDGPGLSSIQLLSNGAFGSAVGTNNTCSGSRSSSISTGSWNVESITTDIPATVSSILTSTVPVSDPTFPSVIFYPFVSATAYYDIYMIIPGCTQLQDCDGRTTVDVEVFPIQGGLGWTSTISEQVTDDTKTLIYSGQVDMSTSGFSPTISLALASQPASVHGSNYIVVADAVQLVLTGLVANDSSSTSSSGTTTANGTTTINSTQLTNSSSKIAFGVYEWIRSSSSNAASTLSNTTETSLTQLGFSLESALAGTPASSWSINTVSALGSTIYVGGNFSSPGNWSNVISVEAGTAIPLASQGLNGVVSASAVVGNYVYFGGQFTSSAAGASLPYVARYDPSGKSWSSLAGGLDGPVTSLIPSSNQLVVIGNFSNVISSDGSRTSTGGYAIYDTSSSSWSTGGVVFGNVSAVAVPSEGTYLAGKVYGSSGNAVDGVAILSSGSDGSATISSLSGVSFGSTGSAISTPSKRSMHAKRFTHAITRLAERFVNPLLNRATTAPVITSTPSPAPAVLAGAFWTNGSNTHITILGGNFSSNANGSTIEAMAFYSSGGLTAPVGSITGVVRALDVIGNDVYVGGSSVNVQGVGSGLVVYNLAQGEWKTGGMPSLTTASGNVTINAIKSRVDTNTVVVAGSFSSAGSLACPGVCLWDSGAAQWSVPGSGLSSGEVRALDFAGDDSGILVVGGSFVGPSGSTSYVAAYSFGNSSWQDIGPSTSLPGPALALAVDNKNASSIFAAGYSTSDGTPYLSQWNGATWTSQPNSSTLLAGTVIQSLAFVPMTSEHTAVGSIENDRMLMVSGELYLSNSGKATAALYDGSMFYPYLVGTTSTGDLGSGSQLFWSNTSFSYSIAHFLARGLVVLIAIAIATGLILLLILFFFLIAYLTRRRERKQSADRREMYEKDGGSDVSSTHQNVFNNVQAALEQSLGVRGSLGAGTTATRERGSGGSEYPSMIAGAAVDGDSEYSSGDDSDDEDQGRETTMRYDFDGPDLQPGEMSMKAGGRIVILDDQQSHEWWYARDPVTGREGVVPATYVW